MLSNEGFLAGLGALFASTATKGSVWITTKHGLFVNTQSITTGSYEQHATLPSSSIRTLPLMLLAAATNAGDDCARVLFRAKSGKHTIATLVSADELAQFNAQYSVLLRASMSQLKKTSKSEKKKQAAPLVAGGAGASVA